MAVGKGSINRVSKAVDEKIVTPVEAKSVEEKKEAAVKATAVKKPAAKATAKTPAKKTTSRKPAAKKTVVSKPSAQVEKIIGKKEVHYGVGSTLPTFLM
ncbi:MAG: hypothetical protein PHW34_02420 [Hespellia sp.]|nr:hypothetical protein [Hespellia sp.]